jgi:methylmalonyl-CoA/ethylmalonyl-CoA epimerase
MRVARIDHVGIAVPDLDAAIAWHTGTLGGRLSHRERNPDQGVEEAMIDFDGGARVQLLAPLTADSPIAKFLDRRGPGLQQLAFEVADLESASADLRGAGVGLVYEHPRPGTAGSSINFIRPQDAGGVLVELVQPASGPASVSASPASGTMTT